MAAINTVIWDIGNVLIYWDPRRVYAGDARFDAGMAQHWSDRVIKSPWAEGERDWHAEIDLGSTIARSTAERIARFPQVFPDLARKFPDYPELLKRYFGEWPKAIDAPVPGTRELRDALKAAGYRTLALTNFCVETWPQSVQLYPQLEQFDGIVMSGKVGMVKPDAEIFRYLLETHKVDPACAVFIDDSPPNIATARALGLHAVLFVPDRAEPYKALAQLKASLAALGVG